jgi:glycosyltransferase involved in cell wall biosynthesis
MSMKLAVVAPRFGPEVVGGAETAARAYATRVAASGDWSVEALTTCALDATTWANELPPGTHDDDGVTVHRFPVTRTRAADFDALTTKILLARRGASKESQREWLEAQGPYSPELIDAIASTDADVVAFHPYLFHPTVAGLPHVAGRAVLHPAAHDELVLRIPMYRDVFAEASALAYWSHPEKEFVEQQFRVAEKRAIVLGIGVERGDGDPAAARAATGIGDRPFLLCLGRIEDGKGARLLTECFTQYKARRPSPLCLVFAGPVVHPPEASDDIIVAGLVDEPTKWGMLRGADVLISPSAMESFSIVLMEAWSVGTPALVNARCAVTADHVARARGGFAFGSYAEFEVELDRMQDDAELRAALGDSGRRYVDASFRWPDVVARYRDFLAQVAAHTAGSVST